MDEQKYVLCRKFSLTLISAENLPNVRKVFKSQVYAKVSFGGDKKSASRTPADKHGELNPAWNYRMKFSIEEADIIDYGLQLVVELYCISKLGDRYVGEVYTSIKELFDYACSTWEGNGIAERSFPVKKGSAETGAMLKLSYSFGDTIWEEKPAAGSWKKILHNGASTLLRVVEQVTRRVNLDIQVPIEAEEDA